MGFGTDLSQGTDYDFVTTAPKPPLEVSADFVGMFAAHNRNATAPITYLSSKDAQSRWVGQSGGYALSASDEVPLPIRRGSSRE